MQWRAVYLTKAWETRVIHCYVTVYNLLTICFADAVKNRSTSANSEDLNAVS